MWTSAGPGPSSSSSKQWKSDGRVKIYNSVSARSPLTKSKKKKNREHSNISALTGSVPHKMAAALQSVSALARKLNPCLQTLCNQSSPLSHWFVSDAGKKLYMTRHISPPASDFLAYRTVILGFFNLNIKVRHEIREFLNANL